MLEMTNQTPASPNFERLKAKLRELFELDKVDLDFGIYRVLRQRHTEITEFLDKHLEKTVREALTSHGVLQQIQVEDDLRTAEAAAEAAGISQEQSPRVMELRVKRDKGADLDATADEIYSHLLTFFSRYYQQGDFLGLHRSTVHGREKYMIPYNGEEVKLVWANMDQYYIKSSELLRDYTFHIRKADLATAQVELSFGDVAQEVAIHFKLVEGDTEKDNRKPDGKTTRAFALDPETPFEETDAKTLFVRFRYREHSSERNLQDKLNVDTEKTLADSLPPRWKLLFATDPTYKGKDKKDTRTIFQKHLRRYTAKHLFDYFIHKDLGGFLRRELDFYVKNEVMHLDDIEDTAAPKAEEYLSKIRAIRRCALPVVGMLAQLEEFQKKLWLKKKFVVEPRYCLTLDRVPETLYAEICANEDQWKEWEDLYAISELKPTRTPAFLKANPHLMLDTRHFGPEFTLNLIASIENLDATLDGVCFHSENFQALQVMQERYREQVKCVYIDPPYNTESSKIAYKNAFEHSSWITLVANRIVSSKALLTPSGLYCMAIDDYEVAKLRLVSDEIFGAGNFEATVPVRTKPQGRAVPKGFSTNHDYLLFYRISQEAEVGRLPRRGRTAERYSETDEDGIFAWANFRKTGGASTKQERPRLFYPIYASAAAGIRIPTMEWDEQKRSWKTLEEPIDDEQVVLPIDETGRERVWSWGWERVKGSANELRVETANGRIQILRKYHPNQAGALPGTWWELPEYSASESGTKVLDSVLGIEHPFTYPKSLPAVEDSLRVLSLDESSIALDFFGGSGTTGQAVINLNRSDDGTRKYLLVEMGEYFDTVLVRRLKKVVYSTDWKEGKPQSRNTGISHAFKIVRLESYEDTLNNLHLRRTPDQDAALAKASEATRDQYLLGYFLDVESAGSKSLLDLVEFRDPFGYKLNIATSSAGETKETTVDLVETFNWLLGLKVKHIDTAKGFLSVTGEKRAGGRTLILWRTLSDDSVADNAALDKFLAKLAVNPADNEFEFIYVNGSHTLNDPHNKVHLIEETFQRLMFDTTNFESLS